jgi:hypothetical protein
MACRACLPNCRPCKSRMALPPPSESRIHNALRAVKRFLRKSLQRSAQELEAGVGIALRNPLLRHKIACSSEESSRIRPYPFLIRSNHFGARFGAHRYTKFSQVLREKL